MRTKPRPDAINLQLGIAVVAMYSIGTLIAKVVEDHASLWLVIGMLAIFVAGFTSFFAVCASAVALSMNKGSIAKNAIGLGAAAVIASMFYRDYGYIVFDR